MKIWMNLCKFHAGSFSSIPSLLRSSHSSHRVGRLINHSKWKSTLNRMKHLRKRVVDWSRHSEAESTGLDLANKVVDVSHHLMTNSIKLNCLFLCLTRRQPVVPLSLFMWAIKTNQKGQCSHRRFLFCSSVWSRQLIDGLQRCHIDHCPFIHCPNAAVFHSLTTPLRTQFVRPPNQTKRTHRWMESGR